METGAGSLIEFSGSRRILPFTEGLCDLVHKYSLGTDTLASILNNLCPSAANDTNYCMASILLKKLYLYGG